MYISRYERWSSPLYLFGESYGTMRSAGVAGYLSERGISPGSSFTVLDKQPFDGPLFLEFGDDTHVIGGTLARAMRVEVTA